MEELLKGGELSEFVGPTEWAIQCIFCSSEAKSWQILGNIEISIASNTIKGRK